MLFIALLVGLCLAIKMTAEATYRRAPGMVDHTASGAVTAGEILQLADGRAGVALADIADTKVGTLYTEGHFDVASASGTTFSKGDRAWWDVSASLAIAAGSADEANGDFPIGPVIVAKVSGDLVVRVDLNAAFSPEIGDIALEEGSDISMGATTGSMIATAAAQKLGFHGATPVIQRASAAQAAVVTTGSTNSSPYGFATAAQGDAIVALVNELRAALVAKGIIKGSA